MEPILKPLLAVDLFAGAGGLTLGLKRAGFNVVGAVEIEDVARRTYLMNHPKVKHLWENVKDVTGKEILESLSLEKGELDLLAGCPPCQGFSSIRTRNLVPAAEDSRNDLVFEFLRLIEEVEPRAIMLENVPGLMKDLRMKQVLEKLGGLGYYNGPEAVKVLDAADYGVPQRRRRMILMTTKYGPVSFADKMPKRKTVKSSIGRLSVPGNTGDPVHDVPEKRTPHIMEMIRNVPKDGGSRASLAEKYVLECHKSFDGFSDVYGRMAWRDVSPTITSGFFNPSKGRFLHPEQNRAITPREAALLQGFPKKYRFSLSRGKTFCASMIGNAFPPEFGYRHAKKIAEALRTVAT